MPTAITQSPTRGVVAGEIDMRIGSALGDLQQREIGLLVGADDLGRKRLAVVDGHGHVGRVFDDVIVGHDIAVGRNDEAGALRLRPCAAWQRPNWDGVLPPKRLKKR